MVRLATHFVLPRRWVTAVDFLRAPRLGAHRAPLQLRKLRLQEPGVFRRLYLAQDGGDAPVAVDDESRPLGAHVFLAVQAFLDPDAVVADDFFLGIGEQREGELI